MQSCWPNSTRRVVLPGGVLLIETTCRREKHCTAACMARTTHPRDAGLCRPQVPYVSPLACCAVRCGAVLRALPVVPAVLWATQPYVSLHAYIYLPVYVCVYMWPVGCLQDLVIPGLKPATHYERSPFMGHYPMQRDILLYFRGDVGVRRKPNYSRGIRQKLFV